MFYLMSRKKFFTSPDPSVIQPFTLFFSGSSSRNRLVKNDSADEDSDVDGIPLDVQTPSSRKSVSNSSAKQMPAGFVPSKWETVDPEEVQAQALTSKWDICDQKEGKGNDD